MVLYWPPDGVIELRCPIIDENSESIAVITMLGVDSDLQVTL